MASTGRTFQKIFIGNLPWTVGHSELRNYFKEFGRVISANVVFDKNSGCSKGYGFVVMNNKTALSNVEKKSKHVLEGSVIQISPAQY